MNDISTPEGLLARCVALAEEKKGRDLVSLKMAGLTLICDYFLIVTAGSTRQAQAICD
ncbi:MAG: RsfS/YbeB/iojap family protein, partial [Firmicutes bacterium]|nr:RsfS/YbeB/iojap family protein [Bacillota bacterium]